MEMFNRDNFKLIGPVRSVEYIFSVLEVNDQKTVEIRTEPADYLLFDSDGRLLEEISSERELLDDVYKGIYVYDAECNLVEREEYARDETLTGKSLFEIDDKGNLVESRYYVSAGGALFLGSKLIHGQNDDIQIIHFDANGKAIESSSGIKFPVQTVETSKTQTDEGYIVEELRYNEKKELTLRTVTNHDHQGNKTEFSCYEPDGTMYVKEEYTYEFDSIGNWTTQITSRWVVGWGEFRLIPYTSTRRKIEYFNYIG